MKAAFAVIAALIIISGCGRSATQPEWIHGASRNLVGTTIEMSVYDQLVEGVTRREDVVELLGWPSCQKNSIAGSDIIYVNVLDKTNKIDLPSGNIENYYVLIEHIVILIFRESILEKKLYMTNEYRQGNNIMVFPDKGPQVSCYLD